MKLINLTPHEITVQGHAIPPSGTVCRVETRSEDLGYIYLGVGGEKNQIPVIRQTATGVSGLPEPQQNTFYLVSSMVAAAIAALWPKRNDILAPTGLARDANGNVTGCAELQAASRKT